MWKDTNSRQYGYLLYIKYYVILCYLILNVYEVFTKKKTKKLKAKNDNLYRELKKMIDVVIIGCGWRGQVFAEYAKTHPEEMRVLAIADKKQHIRDKMKKEYNIEDKYVFEDYHDLFKQGKIGDAVFIATQDNQHIEPSMMALEVGYRNLMVEKPIDRDISLCNMLNQKAQEVGAKIQICHSLRFAPYYRKMKEIIDSGVIGEIKHINQEEGVGYFHYSHSFVRGDWRREDTSSPMILAKCCHDMDLVLYLTDSHAVEVSSYGVNDYFTEKNAPNGAAARCIDCEVRETCPFDAIKIYNEKEGLCWSAVEKEGFADFETAMREGRYGRCVFYCDNDVVDHQSVNILFETGATATITMNPFTKFDNRETRIMGTRGELSGSFGENVITVKPFLGEVYQVEVEKIDSGHGGADIVFVSDFLESVRGEKEMCTPIDISIESHVMCHAAEISRKNSRSVKVKELL